MAGEEDGVEVDAEDDGAFTVRLTGMVWGELLAPALAIVIVAKYVPAEFPEVLKFTVMVSDSPVELPLAGLQESQLVPPVEIE